jgi:transposase InsO family protein
VRRYRLVYRKRRRQLAMSLRWRRVGAVWAIDFTEPPTPIDGQFGQLLAVRDLGSGKMLASLPLREASADNVRDLLRALFAEHRAPLVLKSDNGSALVAAEVKDLLDNWGVTALTSPPGTPRYNGACEAGIGGLKTRAHHIAARHGRPGAWTCDDVEAARLMANEMGRPASAAGPTPDEAWRAQPAIDANERRRFQIATENQRHELRQQLDSEHSEPFNGRADGAAIERLAITQALIALGILELRRRRITTSATGRRVRKIS